MKFDISAGLITSFIRPKRYSKVYSRYLEVAEKNNDIKLVMSRFNQFQNAGLEKTWLFKLMIVADFIWVLSLPFVVISFEESIAGFMRVTIIAVVLELIIKSNHSKYKYF